MDRQPGQARDEARFEYKFVRVDPWGAGTSIWKRRPISDEYQTVIQEHAEEGWRLVQVFAPSLAQHGYSKFFEMIFEREVARV